MTSGSRPFVHEGLREIWQFVSARAKDIVIGILLAIVLTVGLAVATVVLAIFSGIDPRNHFWGNALSNLGVLVVPVFGWPAGMLWIWSEFWDNPAPKKRR